MNNTFQIINNTTENTNDNNITDLGKPNARKKKEIAMVATVMEKVLTNILPM
jgi:hypothetical protein